MYQNRVRYFGRMDSRDNEISLCLTWITHEKEKVNEFTATAGEMRLFGSALRLFNGNGLGWGGGGGVGWEVVVSVWVKWWQNQIWLSSKLGTGKYNLVSMSTACLRPVFSPAPPFTAGVTLNPPLPVFPGDSHILPHSLHFIPSPPAPLQPPQDFMIPLKDRWAALDSALSALEIYLSSPSV